MSNNGGLNEPQPNIEHAEIPAEALPEDMDWITEIAEEILQDVFGSDHSNNYLYELALAYCLRHKKAVRKVERKA